MRRLMSPHINPMTAMTEGCEIFDAMSEAGGSAAVFFRTASRNSQRGRA